MKLNKATLTLLLFLAAFIYSSNASATTSAGRTLFLPASGSAATVIVTALSTANDSFKYFALSVTSILSEQGVVVDFDTAPTCFRTYLPNILDVDCTITSVDLTVTDGCEYCGEGIAIAFGIFPFADINAVLPPDCKVYNASREMQ